MPVELGLSLKYDSLVIDGGGGNNKYIKQLGCRKIAEGSFFSQDHKAAKDLAKHLIPFAIEHITYRNEQS